MSIDAAGLQDQLAAARDTRDHLDRVITWLEEGVELFAGPQPVLELPAPEPDHQDDHETDMRRGGSRRRNRPSRPPRPTRHLHRAAHRRCAPVAATWRARCSG
jgi:hypothetical protein